MAGGTVAAFWAVSFLFVITPGADWAYAIAAGLRHRVVLPAVGGLLVGHLTATAVVAAGVGALVARSPLVLTVLTAVGAAYLVWLGIGMLAHPAAPQAHASQPAGSWLRQAAKGAGISGLNPKVFAVLGSTTAVHRPGRDLADPSTDRDAGVGPCDQLRCGLHRRGHRRPASTAGTTRRSPCSDPLLRYRNDRDRCRAAGRTADRLDAELTSEPE